MSIKEALNKAGIKAQEKPNRKKKPAATGQQGQRRKQAKLPNPLNVGKTHLNLNMHSDNDLCRVLSMGFITLHHPKLGGFVNLTSFILFTGFGKGHPSYRNIKRTKMRELLARNVIDWDDQHTRLCLLDGYRAIAAGNKWVEEALVANELRFECYSVRKVGGLDVPYYHADSQARIWAVEELSRELKAKAAGKPYTAKTVDYSYLTQHLAELMEEVVEDTPAEDKPFVARVKDKDFTASSEVDEVGFSMDAFDDEESEAAKDAKAEQFAKALTEALGTEKPYADATVIEPAVAGEDEVDPADIEVDDFFHEDGTPIKTSDFFPETEPPTTL